MSCRVVGLGVELAAICAIAAPMLAAYPRIVARVVETDANALARDLFARCGWTQTDGEWSAAEPGAPPAHIKLVSAL